MGFVSIYKCKRHNEAISIHNNQSQTDEQLFQLFLYYSNYSSSIPFDALDSVKCFPMYGMDKRSDVYVP